MIKRVNLAVRDPCPSCDPSFSGQGADFLLYLLLSIEYIIGEAFIGPRNHLILVDLFPRLLHLNPEN